MNPYDFVRIEWDRGVERRPARHHDSFSGLSGRVEGTITALTPCFIREPKSAKSRRRPTTGYCGLGSQPRPRIASRSRISQMLPASRSSARWRGSVAQIARRLRSVGASFRLA